MDRDKERFLKAMKALVRYVKLYHDSNPDVGTGPWRADLIREAEEAADVILDPDEVAALL